MKKIISITLVCLLLASAISGCTTNSSKKYESYDMEKIDSSIVKGNTEFAFNIFKELNKEDKEKNIFISPLSISTALSMTYQGAKGSTKEGMEEALGYKGIDIEVLNEGYKNLLTYLSQADDKIELNIGNSIWIREGEKIKEEFITTNKDMYNAQVSELDFSKEASVDTINKWIDNSTKGKITKMLEPPIPGNVIMYLINAIYFKGEWTEQFEEKRTFKTQFHNGLDEKEDIMMMNRTGAVEYGAGEDYSAVRLPYGNEKTSMYAILPDEKISINDFVKAMDSDKWQEIKTSLSKKDDVIIQIPRFKMEYGIKKLNDGLSNLGMEEAFSDTADLSGIREGIFISRVLHKAVIEVNEEGSEAAGVTVVEVTESAQAEPTSFIADRPFLFIIADDELETIVFMGKLYNIN